MVAGKEVSPSDVKNTEKLKQYWEHGKGAAKIGWGTQVGHDFDRCVAEVTTAVKGKMTDSQVKGYCANLHHDVLGVWPGGEHPGGNKGNKGKGK
jgi:hypothetical protein